LEDISSGYWSLDGSLIATVASTGKISVRDGQTFESVVDLVGAPGDENLWATGALLFSKDASVLLTNVDGPGRLWEVQTGQQIGLAFETHRTTNSGVNEGENLQLITGTEEHALIWNLNMDEWPEIACKTAGSNLTEDEWRQWGPRDEDYRAICPQFPLPE
jgi:WD40 repeat protein